MTKKSNHTLGKVVGVAAIAGAAFGAYLLYGSKDAQKKKALIKGWMLKMKGEVLEKIEDAKEVTEDGYNRIVDEVAVKYKALKNMDTEEFKEVVDEVKGHFKSIQKEFSKSEKEVRSGKAEKTKS